ncbi:MAG: hypothetical protein MUE44_05855 [Oscillatoriaceae cyanobacterium Prado104]|nr:hypothetical protein [Oscillatoriaceae cyanobacterium Prado104]
MAAFTISLQWVVGMGVLGTCGLKSALPTIFYCGRSTGNNIIDIDIVGWIP